MLFRFPLPALLPRRGLHGRRRRRRRLRRLGRLQLDGADVGAAPALGDGRLHRRSARRRRPAGRWSGRRRCPCRSAGLPVCAGLRVWVSPPLLASGPSCGSWPRMLELSGECGRRRGSARRSNEPVKAPSRSVSPSEDGGVSWCCPRRSCCRSWVSGAPPASTRMIPPLRYPVLLATVEPVTVTSVARGDVGVDAPAAAVEAVVRGLVSADGRVLHGEGAVVSPRSRRPPPRTCCR